MPPHAPLVPLREATSSGASAADLARAHSGAGSRRRSLEAPEIFGTRDGNEAVPRAVPASRSGAGRAAEGRARGAHERPPETVTDAFSAAMAKGLDLVSGKNAAADAARDANGGGGDVRSAPTGVFTEAIHRFDGGVTGSESVGLASDRTPRALYASGAPGDAWAPRGVLVAHQRVPSAFSVHSAPSPVVSLLLWRQRCVGRLELQAAMTIVTSAFVSAPAATRLGAATRHPAPRDEGLAAGHAEARGTIPEADMTAAMSPSCSCSKE